MRLLRLALETSGARESIQYSPAVLATSLERQGAQCSLTTSQMTKGPRHAQSSNARSIDSDSTFEPMNHPGHLVRRLHQICVAVFLDAAKDYNLTHIQFATLLAIERFPGIDQTRVSKLVALDRQTTSNVVTRLCQFGLIERTRKDMRTNALHVTGPGRALIDVMQPRIAGIDEIILGPLSNGERETLMVLLKKLVESNNDLSRAPHAAGELIQSATVPTPEASSKVTRPGPRRPVVPGPRANRERKARA